MSNEERGLYITLLCIQWSKGGIDNDTFDRLSSGMAQPLASYVKSKFVIGSDGHLRNTRMEDERAKQDAFRANRSESGKAGAKSRWHSHSTAIAQPMANDSSPSPSPSPSPLINTRKVASAPSSNEAFMESLKSNPAYVGIDIQREFGKMTAWCSTRSKKPTQRRFVNWLNNCDKPMTNGAVKDGPAGGRF